MLPQILMPTLRSIIKILSTPPCCKLQPRPSYTTSPTSNLSLPPAKRKTTKNRCISSNLPFPLEIPISFPFSNEIRHCSSYHGQPSSFRFSGGFTGGFRLGLRLWAGDLQVPGGSRSRSASIGPNVEQKRWSSHAATVGGWWLTVGGVVEPLQPL